MHKKHRNTAGAETLPAIPLLVSILSVGLLFGCGYPKSYARNIYRSKCDAVTVHLSELDSISIAPNHDKIFFFKTYSDTLTANCNCALVEF